MPEKPIPDFILPGKSNQIISPQEAIRRKPDLFDIAPGDEDYVWRLTLRHLDGRIEELPLGTEWQAVSRFGSSRSIVVVNSDGTLFDSVKHEIPPSIVVVAWGKDLKTGEIKIGLISEKRPMLDNPNEPAGHDSVMIQQIPMGFMNEVFGENEIKRLETPDEATRRELSEEIGAGVVKEISYPAESYMHVSANIGGHPPTVLFAEVDLKRLDEIRPQAGEQINNTEFVTLNELLKYIKEGKSDNGYSRLASSNTAILMFLSHLSSFQNAERNQALLSEVGKANKAFKQADPEGYVKQMLRQSYVKHPEKFDTDKAKAEVYLSTLLHKRK